MPQVDAGLKLRKRTPIGLEEVRCLGAAQELEDVVEPGDILFTADNKAFDRLTMAVDGLWSHSAIVAGRMRDLHLGCDGGAGCSFQKYPLPIGPIPERKAGQKPVYPLVRSCAEVLDKVVVVHQHMPGLVVWELNFLVEKYKLVGLLRPNKKQAVRDAAAEQAYKSWQDFPGIDIWSDDDADDESKVSDYAWGELITAGWLAAKADFRKVCKCLASAEMPDISPAQFQRLLDTQEREQPWDPTFPVRATCSGFVQRMYRSQGAPITPSFNRGVKERGGRLYDVPHEYSLESLLAGDVRRVMDGTQERTDEDVALVSLGLANYRSALLVPVEGILGPVGNWHMLKMAIGGARKRHRASPGGALIEEAASPTDLWHSPDREIRMVLRGLDSLRLFPRKYRRQLKKHETSGCTLEHRMSRDSE